MLANSDDVVTAYLALGGNLGDRLANLRGAVFALDERTAVSIDWASGIAGLYETSPIGGPVGQPDYLNSCVRITTSLKPLTLLALLRAVESEFGRIRGDPWGPRTIDLDITLFGDVVCRDRILTVPHPNVAERGFVLEPLAEIAGDVIHPTMGISVAELRNRWRARATGDRVARLFGPEWCRPK